MQWGKAMSTEKPNRNVKTIVANCGQILVQFWKWLNKKIYPGIDQG